MEAGSEKSHIPRESKEWIEKLLDDWREKKFQELKSNRHCITRRMAMPDSVKKDILRPAFIHGVVSKEPVELDKLVTWPTLGLYNATGGVLPTIEELIHIGLNEGKEEERYRVKIMAQTKRPSSVFSDRVSQASSKTERLGVRKDLQREELLRWRRARNSFGLGIELADECAKRDAIKKASRKAKIQNGEELVKRLHVWNAKNLNVHRLKFQTYYIHVYMIHIYLLIQTDKQL